MFKEHRVCPCPMSSVTYFYANISGWTWPLVSREVKTQRVFAAIFKIMGTTYWDHELDLARSHDIIDRMTIQLTICYFLLCPTGTESLSSTVFEIFEAKYIGAMTLTFQDSWRHPSRDHLILQVAISYRCSIVTESVSSHWRDNGPQTYWGHNLTFLGHVTSSVTWPIDLPHALSYWWPIDIESIFNSFPDICIQIYLGHDLDLSGSRDVTGHVTISYPRCHCRHKMFKITSLLDSLTPKMWG